VERVKHFAELIEVEAAEETDHDPPADWPVNGSIVVSKLRAGYREGPDIILGISFEIAAQEKIGVVGRTGSGKSSLMLVFLRLVLLFVWGVLIRAGLTKTKQTAKQQDY